MNNEPKISVIIPAYNAELDLPKCLEALSGSSFTNYEVIISDDGSTDDTLLIARSRCASVLISKENRGPAAARNTAAAIARAPVLFFLDADVQVQPDTLQKVAEVMFSANPPSAMFCSYQPDTPAENFVSKYKNLQHHFTHQQSRSNAQTFCGGFGAVQSDVFQRMGGFDIDLRAMEDVDFGYRMSGAGYEIQLHPEIQLTHLKVYSLSSLIRSDVFMRAIPWTRLMLEKRRFHNDLNLRTANVLSTPVTWLLIFSCCAFLIGKDTALLSGLLLGLLVVLNRKYLSFVSKRHGYLFGIGSLGMLVLFYSYSAIGAASGFVSHYVEALAEPNS